MRLKRPVAVGALSMVIVAGVCSMPLLAQAPGVGHTFPAGGPAGTTVTVQLLSLIHISEPTRPY